MADGDKDVGPSKEVKSTLSLGKKKASTRGLFSKSSLKKLSSTSQTSEGSDASLVNKRQSEFERIMKAPRYQNTYRLDSKYPFKPDEVYKIIASIVEREGADALHYDAVVMSKMSQMIANEVRTTVKHLNYDRYKICVFVCIGENKLQGFHSMFRALWDMDRDAWTTYYYQCRTYFISCTCFGLYHD